LAAVRFCGNDRDEVGGQGAGRLVYLDLAGSYRSLVRKHFPQRALSPILFLCCAPLNPHFLDRVYGCAHYFQNYRSALKGMCS